MHTPWTLNRLAQLLDTSSISQDVLFTDITYDSRDVKPGSLFLAIKGERSDGHDFIPDVEAKGAVALLVNRPVSTRLPHLVLPDVITSIGKAARIWRERYTLPVLAVTGSNGKTTTKSMMTAIIKAALLGQEEALLVTSKSHNTPITLPIYLLHLNELHQFAVLEMGMSHFGEIAYLSRLVQPTIAIITNALPSHLAGVGGTVKGVAQAKGEIFEGLNQNGTAILNRDDHFFDYWKRLAGSRNVISFGLSSHADITADKIELLQGDCRFQLHTPAGDKLIRLPLLGKHNIRNALAATAAGLAAGIDLEAIQEGLFNLTIPYQRLKMHHLSNGVVLIDDTYNANPASTQAAIDVLAKQKGKKVLVIGDMKELGEQELIYHQEIGTYAKQEGIDELYGFGKLAQQTVLSFGPHAEHFESKQDIVDSLKSLIQQGNLCILVKGSRSMAMEDIIHEILNHFLDKLA